MNRLNLTVHWKSLRKEGLVAPAGVMGLFAAAVLVVQKDVGLARKLVEAFQGAVPLLAGMLASGLMVGDPALELILSSARSPFRVLVGRFVALLATITAATLAFEILALGLGVLPPRPAGPLGWVPPWFPGALALGALGSLVGLGAGDRTVGALAAGTVWMAQFVAGDAMRAIPWLWPFDLFLALRTPAGAAVVTNTLALAALGVVLSAACAPLLRRPERYL